jgi:hypothetical protein
VLYNIYCANKVHQLWYLHKPVVRAVEQPASQRSGRPDGHHRRASCSRSIMHQSPVVGDAGHSRSPGLPADIAAVPVLVIGVCFQHVRRALGEGRKTNLTTTPPGVISEPINAELLCLPCLAACRLPREPSRRHLGHHLAYLLSLPGITDQSPS